MKKIRLLSVLMIMVLSIVLSPFIAGLNTVQAATTYKLPYPAGKKYMVTQDEFYKGESHNSDENKIEIDEYAIDFGMQEGSEVAATADGTVIGMYEGSNRVLYNYNESAFYTNYVLIDHGNGVSSLYAHLQQDSVTVSNGDFVRAGQVIGKSGKTGFTKDRAHLHFALQNTPSGRNYSNAAGYWKQSVPVRFSDPDVLRQDSNGIVYYKGSYISSNTSNPGSSTTLNTGRLVGLGKCLDLYNNNRTNGNKVHLWDCNALEVAQMWHYDQNSGRIYFEHDRGKCLNLYAGKTTDGNQVGIWDCDNTDDQKWTVTDSGEIKYRMNQSKCLDISAASTANGTKIQIWGCNGTNAQKWAFSGSLVRGGVNGRCMDASGGKMLRGDRLVLWDCSGNANQRWNLNQVSHEIKSLNEKCLDADNGQTANGTIVHLWDCNGGTNQQWRTDSLNRIVSMQSGKCLNEHPGNGAQGNQIVLWDCLNQSNQRWLW